MHPATKAKAKAAMAGALGLGAGIVGLTSAASAAEPTQQELMDQIKALQAKVDQMEARQNQAASQTQPASTQPTAAQPGTTQPAEQPAGQGASVDSVLRDAERRSSPSFLQGGGLTAGYQHNRFTIQDEKGDFVLNPSFQFQFRHVADFRSDDTAAGNGSDTIDSGFEVRRMKLIFEGNAFGPNLTYRFQWSTDQHDGHLTLEDAWGRYALGDAFGNGGRNFAVRFGQFKDPTFHEEITSPMRQLAADRSMVNEVLGGGVTDRVQGVSLIWDDGPEGSPFRAEIGFDDGIHTINTNFQDGGGNATFGADNPSWGAFARVECLAMGNWKQYDDFTTLGNGSQNLLVFGAGASYTESANTAGGADTLLYTADVQYEAGRLGLYGAFYGAYGEPAGATEGGTNDWGFLAQAGYMLVADKWELFARYDMISLDDARLSSGAEDTFPELTVGLNYYLKGHAAKFTIDGTWLPSGAPQNLDGIGILDPDGDQDQFVIRTQFQLVI
jgi:hypothetical protein